MNKVYFFPERAPKPAPTAEDWATEYAAAAAFDRPVRGNLCDSPFYPWMPKETKFSVTFKLGWKP